MKITLPWPPREANPNWRGHWAKKAVAVKAYRRECFVRARNAGLKIDWEGQIQLWVTFYAPDRRRRDDDNVFASFKAGRDALADALGVDDHRFRYRPFLSSRVHKNGAVEVAVTPGPEGVVVRPGETLSQADDAGITGG